MSRIILARRSNILNVIDVAAFMPARRFPPPWSVEEIGRLLCRAWPRCTYPAASGADGMSNLMLQNDWWWGGANSRSLTTPNSVAPNFEPDWNKPATAPMLVAIRSVDGERVPAETGHGPVEQTPSMGCSIKWRG